VRFLYLSPSYQGDQIGQIFALWAIIYIGQLCKKITEVGKKFGLFFHGKRYELILTQMVLAIFLGFFTNSSGHPASSSFSRPHILCCICLSFSVFLSPQLISLFSSSLTFISTFLLSALSLHIFL
jgi:hypothetical protein